MSVANRTDGLVSGRGHRKTATEFLTEEKHT